MAFDIGWKREKNVGDYEAIVRGVLGATGLALAIGQRNPLWLVLAVVGFGTAVTRFCPLNEAFGINTFHATTEGEGEREEETKTAPTIH